MRRTADKRGRFVRDVVGMSLEVGLTVAMMIIALVIAMIATRGRF